jgi:hypothetical protein
MVLGALMLMGRLNLLDVARAQGYWPLLLIALGLVQMLVPDSEGRRGGLWLFATGVLLQLHVLRILRLHDSWPLFLVIAGAQIVTEILGARRRDDPLEENHDA